MTDAYSLSSTSDLMAPRSENDVTSDSLMLISSPLPSVRSQIPTRGAIARDGIEDRIAGLDGGADDYLTKPFSFAELLARLRALGRRGLVEKPTLLETGGLRLDPATRQVWRGDSEIALSSKEFALLETFMRRPGEVLSRYQLLEHAWDYEYENRSNVVDVYVRYLREKVDRPFGVESIETVRGAGYRMRGDGGRRAAGAT